MAETAVAETTPPPPLSRAAWALLGLLCGLRVALGAARFAAAPARFANVEESYNATVAWLLGHAPVWDLLPTLQYRSFCGGCTVVSLVGAGPLARFGDHAWAWKLVPLGWSAAMVFAMFFALRRLAGTPAAWAGAVLSALPPLGMLDLSLMAWGNHQEAGLFVLVALWAWAAGRPGLGGAALGLGVAFARTDVYALAVLAPLCVWHPRGRGVAAAGLAVGLALLAIPTAGGDAGWYRMFDPVGTSPGGLERRLLSLLGPEPLGRRLYLPHLDLSVGAAAWLVLGVAGAWIAGPRARVVAALQASWVVAYAAVSFPVFLINARVPVNNVRYHGPWALVLTLGAALGIGALWARGRRAAAVGAAAVLLAPSVVALGREPWRPDPAVASLPIVDLAGFVPMVLGRLDANDLDREADDPRAAALLERMRGLELGRRRGADGVAEAGTDPDVLAGLGEALVEPCASPETVREVLASVSEAARPAVARGASLTLSFCGERRAWAPAAWVEALGPELAGTAGAAAWERCGRAAAPLGCVASALDTLPTEAREPAAYGAGRAWADPRRAPAELGAAREALAEYGDAFHAGATDPAAGSRMPAWGRQAPR